MNYYDGMLIKPSNSFKTHLTFLTEELSNFNRLRKRLNNPSSRIKPQTVRNEAIKLQPLSHGKDYFTQLIHITQNELESNRNTNKLVQRIRGVEEVKNKPRHRYSKSSMINSNIRLYK